MNHTKQIEIKDKIIMSIFIGIFNLDSIKIKIKLLTNNLLFIINILQ